MDAYDVLVATHATCGAVGLCAMVPPLVARKGGALHRRAGWVFAAAMTGTATTGLVICALWVFAPLVVKPVSDGASEAWVAAHVASLRQAAGFLGFLACFLLSAVWHGLRSVGVKRGSVRPGDPLDVAVAGGTMLGGLGLAVAGLALGVPLFAIFGCLGVWSGWTDLQVVRQAFPTRMGWWYRHMSQMCGASIAAVTAFLVFNARSLVDLPDSLMLVPWLLPTLVGTPLVTVWVRRYRVRFGELG